MAVRIAAGFLLLAAVALPAIAAAPGQPATRKLLVSFLPIEIFTRQVVAGIPGFQVERLVPAAIGCPHHYPGLSGQDLKKAQRAEVLVINGAGLEDFLLPALRRINPRLSLIDASAGLALLPAGGDEEHGHRAVNAHLFASPAQAALQLRAIGQGLAGRYPGATAALRANTERRARQYEELAAEMRQAAAALANPRVVAASDVFDYLLRDLGLTLVGKVEEQPGQVSSGRRLLQLKQLISEKKPAAIWREPSDPARLAVKLAAESGLPVVVLDPLTGGPETAGPDYYLQRMRGNLQALRALARRSY